MFRPRFLTASALVGLLTGIPHAAARAPGAPFSRDSDERAFPQREPRHVSLLIGIGKYQHAEFTGELGARSASELTGTGNDISRMQKSLRGWGFADGPDQKILRDAQASKQGIDDAFRWLAERASDSSDVVVIFYAGHGSWAPDSAIDATRRRDEDDGFDEAIVPWDVSDLHASHQLVLDDEIGEWLKRLKTSNVTMIIDACHSGTVSRGQGATYPRGRGPRPPSTGTLPVGGLLGGDRNLNHVLLTGAAPWEQAYESVTPEGHVTGQFTYYLSDALDKARRGSTSYDDLVRQVHARLGVARQTPQLEGDGSAVLFRVNEGIPQRPFVVVTAASAGRVRLDVGSIHGARRGSVYDVYGPAETAFTAAAPAQVRVDSIADSASFAMVIDNKPPPMGGRAVLSRMPMGVSALDKLTLYIDPSARAVRDSISRVYPWIAIADKAADAPAILRRNGDLFEILVAGEQIAPLVGDYTERRARGDTTRADIPRGYIGSATALCGPLRRAYSAVGLQLLRNTSGSIGVDIRLLPASVTTPPPQPTATAIDTAYVGDLYTLWAWVSANESGVRRRDVFLSAVTSGYTAEPFALWPLGAAPAVSLNPDQVNRPMAIVRNIRISPVTGIEIVKAYAGVERFDFRQYVNRLPACAGSRGDDRNPWTTTDEIEGWSASERRIEFLPRPPQPPR